MTQEEVEGQWDPRDKKVQAKWEKFTRAERKVFSERREKRNVMLHTRHGIGEEEAERAIAPLDKTGS